MMELDAQSWLILIACGILIGISKTGISTLGMFAVVVMILLLPARNAIGLVLPALIMGDIIAVSWYRRTVRWRLLASLLPWVLIGLIAGYLVLIFVSNHQLSLLMGILIFTLTVLQLIKEHRTQHHKDEPSYPKTGWFTAIMGVLGGFATMIGNVAGIIMAIYLISKRLPKNEFVGTGAWYFLIVNVIKVPFYVSLGIINHETLTWNLWMALPVLIGGIIGIKMLQRIPQQMFNTVVLYLGAAGAIWLIVSSLF